MRKLRLREDKSPSQSCAAPTSQKWAVTLAPAIVEPRGPPTAPVSPQCPTGFSSWLCRWQPACPLLEQPPHTWPSAPLVWPPSPSSSQRRGPTGRPVHVRKFQPREPSRARDSEQPVALGETETWLVGGGVVTGDLKSCHFLGPQEGTGRSQQLREALSGCEPVFFSPPCTSAGATGL